MAIGFVTGGSGFVGRNLIMTLKARGDEVHALRASTLEVTVNDQKARRRAAAKHVMNML